MHRDDHHYYQYEDSHLRIPLSTSKFSRREFVVVSLAAGFALSVLPVSAQTITAVEAQNVSIEASRYFPWRSSIPARPRCPRK